MSENRHDVCARGDGGLLQNIARSDPLAMLLQISFLTIRHRERERETERGKKPLRRLNVSLSFVYVALELQSVYFASDYLPFSSSSSSPRPSLLRVHNEMDKSTSERGERPKKLACVSHVPLAIHNHPFHSLPFLFFILVASSTTASSLEALRRSCVLVVTVAEACKAWWSN